MNYPDELSLLSLVRESESRNETLVIGILSNNTTPLASPTVETDAQATEPIAEFGWADAIGQYVCDSTAEPTPDYDPETYFTKTFTLSTVNVLDQITLVGEPGLTSIAAGTWQFNTFYYVYKADDLYII